MSRIHIAILSLSFLLAPARSAAAEERHEPFRVMTYNVRQVNAADTGAYDWSQRSAKVVELIRDNDPDIFGVQESSSPVIQEDLAAGVADSHDRYQPPNGSPKTIFYRRDRFELADLPEPTGFAGLPNAYPEDHACFPNARGRTAAWVKLRDRRSGRTYLVVNAHIAHGAACSLGRVRAVEALHELIEGLAGGLPIIVMGDFNSDPQHSSGSGAGDATVATLEAPRADYQLARSARHSGATSASTATFNSSWKNPSTAYARLDYIFTSGVDMTTAAQRVDRREIGGISPSDHFAVLATVRHAIFGPAPLADGQGDGALDGTALAFADVDGDGAADKLSWNPAVAGGALRVHLNDGAGAFSGALVAEAGPAATADSSWWFADIDGDRCADWLARDPAVGGGALELALSTCDGGFAPPGPGPELENPAARVLLADLDVDGCADLVSWDPAQDGGRTRTRLSRCDGTFAGSILNEDEGASTNPGATFALADVNGDGAADKIVWDTEAAGGRTRIYASGLDGTFTLLSEHESGTSGVSTSRFLFADVDADGHADKLFWRPSFREGRPQLYLGGQAGFATSPVMINHGHSESDTNRYVLADVDGSGSADLIAWDPAAGEGETRAFLALARLPEEPAPDAGPGAEDPAIDEAGCGCASGAGGGAPTAGLLLGLLAVLGVVRRRR